jgi:hypothetical protein
MSPKKDIQQATVAEMSIKRATIKLVGDSPLIVHAWSAKAKREILDKQMKKAKSAKEAKDPEALFQEALYRMPNNPDKYGFPAVGFKSAAVDACSMVSDMTKVGARGAFHIQGDMVELNYGTVNHREDMVKIAMGTADVRIRPEFIDWSVEFEVRYNSGVISLDQLANLFNVAGFSIGVGEWRPQRDGSFGMFHVESAINID